MKFELKTENENNTRLFSNVFKAVSILVLIIFLCDFAIKLGIITRQYQINYFCRLLSVEKSSSNFKKLSKISSLKSKQKIWEFCKHVFK